MYMNLPKLGLELFRSYDDSIERCEKLDMANIRLAIYAVETAVLQCQRCSASSSDTVIELVLNSLSDLRANSNGFLIDGFREKPFRTNLLHLTKNLSDFVDVAAKSAPCQIAHSDETLRVPTVILIRLCNERGIQIA